MVLVQRADDRRRVSSDCLQRIAGRLFTGRTASTTSIAFPITGAFTLAVAVAGADTIDRFAPVGRRLAISWPAFRSSTRNHARP